MFEQARSFTGRAGLDRRGFVRLTLMGTTAALFPLGGCASAEEVVAPEGKPVSDADKPTGAPRVLTLVFSCSGNTLSVAELVHAKVGGDFYRIVTAEPYPEDYDERVDQGRRELDEGFIPVLADDVETVLTDWDSYDVVFIGFPTWWGHIPQAVRGFLQTMSLDGKAVVPFNTSHSSGWAQTLDDLAELCPRMELLDGLNYTQATLPATAQDVDAWIDGLELDQRFGLALPSEPVRQLGGSPQESAEGRELLVRIEGQGASTEFAAMLDECPTAQAFSAMLPMTLQMSELNGNEKYCYLDAALPSDPSNPGTIEAGDIMLYGDSCVVVFYETFPTSYSYTRIGRIDDPSSLAQALGSGDATVVFEKG